LFSVANSRNPLRFFRATMALMNTAATLPEQSEQPDQYDTPWKEAVEHYFVEFMAFYFPKAHAQIDWARGYTFLEQELQAKSARCRAGQTLRGQAGASVPA